MFNSDHVTTSKLKLTQIGEGQEEEKVVERIAFLTAETNLGISYSLLFFICGQFYPEAGGLSLTEKLFSPFYSLFSTFLLHQRYVVPPNRITTTTVALS